MGLDVTAYKNITFIQCDLDEDYEPLIEIGEDYICLSDNHDFPYTICGLRDDGVYMYETCEVMAAGSYSGYNNWRNLLAKFAGYPESPIVQYGRLEYRYDAGAWLEELGDFIELINFSDCEGTIGTELCEKLYTDFMNNLDRLENDRNYDENFKTKYRGWLSLFELARHDGCVTFH